MSNEQLILPRRTLLVLCGPTGSGKSTFAARRFPETHIVSSDRCRGMICDDENSQAFNRDAFDLFHYILHKRMLLDRFCVADSTALLPGARERLHQLALRYGYFACLLIFDVPPEVCIERDRQRTRQVGEQVVRYHAGLLAKTLQDVQNENWQLLQILHDDPADLEIAVDA
jgi:predicted kinase